MAVGAAPTTVHRLVHRPRIDGWATAGLAAAALVALPLLTVPASFLSPRVTAWWEVTSPILPEALASTAAIVAGVGLGTLALGTGLAALVSFYDFPGRRLLDWALVLPLAMPAYVLAFVALGQLDFASPLQTLLRSTFGPGLRLPEIRSLGGAIVLLTLTLYPYVYLLARASFLGQSQSALDAARSLGASRVGAIRRVALPMARPAIAAGTALAVMEALADFGSVQLMGVQTLTVAIYQVWFGAFDRLAAMQLATILMAVTLTLLALERHMRGRARYHQHLERGAALEPVRLRGVRAVLAAALPAGVLLVVVVAPVGQLVAWAVATIQQDLVRSEMLTWARNSVLLAAVAALFAVTVATVLAYGLRVSPSRTSAAAARLATIGYGLPGSVVAVGTIVSLGWVDRRLTGVLEALGIEPRLILTGTVLGLVFAYVVRFLAVAFQGLEARLASVPVTLDAAARSLGADRLDVLWRVHLPLLRLGLLTAGLLVFVETMKELPATVLLRPLGGDTLAVGVWQSSTESLWETAALPALAIVAVGVVPVLLVVRLSDRARLRLASTSSSASVRPDVAGGALSLDTARSGRPSA